MAIAEETLGQIRTERIATVKRRIPLILGALILAIGFGIGSRGTAYAQNGQQFCNNNYCLNAWNGGPYVNGYTPGVANNYFTIVYQSNGYVNLEFTGAYSAYEYDCVSDYGNSSTDARAGLNGYCPGGQIAWGANFKLYSCNGGLAFKNVHWNGWLAPSSLGDGTPFYLNSSIEACFVVE